MERRRISASVAGVIAGLQMASKSLEPSLMPRSAVDQGLIMAGSFATGYVAGAAAARVLGALPVIGATAVLRLAGVTATAARSNRLLRRLDDSTVGSDDDISAWTEVGIDVLESVSLAHAVSRRRRAVFEAATVAAVAVPSGLEAHAALGTRTDEVDATYLAAASGTAVGIVALSAALVAAVRASGRLARKATDTSGIVGALVSSGAILGAIGILGIGGKAALGRVIGSIAQGNQATESAYADSPRSPNVSGGEHSLIPYETLGLQGRRLVSEVTPVATIEAVMGEPALAEPVRVFVGVQSAKSTEEQVELAIRELRRSGGFDRSSILACSPAGTGYVNYITVEAAELMSRGDIATVAIQYGNLPSMLSMNKVDHASKLYGALVKRLRVEIDTLDRDISLYAYGESLGAKTSQIGLDRISIDSDPPVDGALWVGTPYGTEMFERLTAEGVAVFDSPSQLHEYLADGSPRPGVVFLNHDNDPVAKFTPSMFYAMPDWLKTPDRGRGMNPHQRWLPGIAFWQGIIDTKNAATVVPGEFRSTGHDYRSDLASFVQVAYAFDDVTADQMERIEAKLRASEIERAENIAQGKVQSA